MPDLSITPEQSAKLRVTRALQALERSGNASAALTAGALQTVDNLKRLPELAAAEFSDFHCYGDGCTVTATSRDASTAAAGADAIVRSEQYMFWPGPKFRSGPLPLPSGQVQTVVIFYRSEGNPLATAKQQEAL